MEHKCLTSDDVGHNENSTSVFLLCCYTAAITARLFLYIFILFSPQLPPLFVRIFVNVLHICVVLNKLVYLLWLDFDVRSPEG